MWATKVIEVSAVKMNVDAVVSVKWLEKALKEIKINRGLVVLQVVMVYPDLPNLAKEEFHLKHIPGAIMFDLNECSDKSTDLPYMLPDEASFANYVTSLGIDNNTHVVIYENNVGLGILASARVWWLFQTYQHTKVSVLNGGLFEWIKEGGEIEKGPCFPTKGDQRFLAKLNKNMVKSYGEIVSNVNNGGSLFSLVDSREKEQYDGLVVEPIPPGLPCGRIQYSLNVPYLHINNDKLLLKSVQELQEIFKGNGVNLEEPFTITCHIGLSACLVGLAAYICGCRFISIYDGSWAEYATNMK